ncbi:hypothetical protein K1719_030253 [Acacia pycnantha]|nr:hypothetical protein K1719_030253 [Acacia pycnantha]
MFNFTIGIPTSISYLLHPSTFTILQAKTQLPHQTHSSKLRPRTPLSGPHFAISLHLKAPTGEVVYCICKIEETLAALSTH